MAIAAFWGTIAGYSDYGDKVIIERVDGHVAVISKATFDYLYFKLDDFTTALKEDCVQYAVHEPDKCLMEYPVWFIEACEDGFIFEDETNSCMLYDESGDIAVSPNSMILRNYRGELKHLESYKFYQYYDTLRE